MELINPVVGRWLQDARDDRDGFWARAAERLHWFRRWDSVFEADAPSFRWFSGGRTNLAYNALDRHVAAGDGGRTALVALDERGGERLFSYAQLRHEVERVAAALRGMGVQKGDRVTIYMPTCPEAIVAMLATVRIGAIHCVVFAGFGAGALGGRIEASGSRLVLTADVTWRKGRSVPLKPIVDEAVRSAGMVDHVVVLRRGDEPPPWTEGRDLDWEAFLARGEGQPGGHVEMEANEPAFILATSGTTAKPKLAVHTHGGYQVWIDSQGRWCFGLRPGDVWWSTSDIGWIVGHSYIVYAPLIAGCTTIAYEGALDQPDADAPWRIVERFGVTGLFTSPTAVRLLMRYGSEAPRRHDLRSLERVFCAGEVLNSPAWQWLQEEALGDRVPVIDHMWQTETGGPVFGNPYGVAMLPIKPGSAGIPLAGVEARVVTPDGQPCGPGEKGIMVIERPFPGLIATLWGEPERYGSDYWGRLPGRYWTGDSAHVDEDGYVWFAGRADEIIKIAGHRIGTIEVETALLKHPAVAEVGVTGRPDELRGETISAFVVLRQGHEPSEALRGELLQTARAELGPVAVISDVAFVEMLPKTRSGKIMRRVLKAVVLDQDPGDVTTIEDEGSVEEAREMWRQMRSSVGIGNAGRG
ncbi:MAG TPA: acetate--CoA ligase [Candidatus Limnocylindrales bacterium]|nr:acetate--CoA ligase [Candidatus Limnocylindrales bacterium]